jgi:aryl-alcohol dehydrogenase-like predicted oxidoreductase
MEYVEIEGITRKASRIGLGTWAMGGWMWGGTDEERSIRTICSALDRGVTLIDTAPVYGQGRSEEIVGKAVQRWGQRERVVLATKVGLDWGRRGDPVRNASRTRIEKEFADSLRRLRTDYIDVYRCTGPTRWSRSRRPRRRSTDSTATDASERSG